MDLMNIIMSLGTRAPQMLVLLGAFIWALVIRAEQPRRSTFVLIGIAISFFAEVLGVVMYTFVMPRVFQSLGSGDPTYVYGVIGLFVSLFYAGGFGMICWTALQGRLDGPPPTDQPS